MEWSVRIEISCIGTAFTEDYADQLIDALGGHAPAVSCGPNEMSARFSVEADTVGQASDAGLRLFRAALKKIGLSVPPARIVGYELQASDDLDRSLGEINVPELVGVAELAQILNVSKQRASELARSPGFPKPFALLASGPVWKKGAVARHMGAWERRPGRKKVPALA